MKRHLIRKINSWVSLNDIWSTSKFFSLGANHQQEVGSFDLVRRHLQLRNNLKVLKCPVKMVDSLFLRYGLFLNTGGMVFVFGSTGQRPLIDELFMARTPEVYSFLAVSHDYAWSQGMSQIVNKCVNKKTHTDIYLDIICLLRSRNLEMQVITLGLKYY